MPMQQPIVVQRRKGESGCATCLMVVGAFFVVGMLMFGGCVVLGAIAGSKKHATNDSPSPPAATMNSTQTHDAGPLDAGKDAPKKNVRPSHPASASTRDARADGADIF